MSSEVQPGRALVLIGPMGAGKTSVGRRVARALDRPFTDTDKSIVRDHGPIPEIFATQGEAAFRRMERGAVTEALRGGGVVALGGGAVLDADTRADLGAHDVAFLTVSAATVASRIHGDNRPLLHGEDPLAQWERIFSERHDLFAAVADATFDTSAGPLSRVVDEITRWATDGDATYLEEES